MKDRERTADASIGAEPPEPLHAVEDLLLGKILPLAFFGFFTVAHVHVLLQTWPEFRASGDLKQAGALVSRSLNVVFFFMMTWLYIMRSAPRGRTEKLHERLIALAGSFVIMLTPLARPGEILDARVILLALILQAAGGVLTVWSLSHLRRNFSIIPEARSVVRSGPYRYLRHPMYSSEIVWCAGMILPIASYGVVGLYLLMVFFLYLRARCEERLLEHYFPEYGSYRKETWRLIPYVH